MNLNLHHLELFYYVAEAGGISEAVRLIPYPIQQPAISQQMKSLEERLAVKLFERRPFQLTDAGRMLLATMAPFMEKLATLEDDLRQFDAIKLRIACSAMIADHYLVRLLPELMKAHSSLVPVVKEAEGTTPYRELIAGEVDVVISSEPIPKAHKIRSLELLQLPLTFVARRQDKYLLKLQWTENDIHGLRFVALDEEHAGARFLRESLRELTLAPIFGAQTSSIASALRYIQIGLGVGFMLRPPASLLNQYDLVAFLPKGAKFPSLSLNLAWDEQRLQGELLADFIRQATALAQEAARDI